MKIDEEKITAKRNEFMKEFPESLEQMKKKKWSVFQTKKFVHQKIFLNPEGNEDFILSLDPNLVYYLSQLWEAREEKNIDQWLYFLEKIIDYFDDKLDESVKKKLREKFQITSETFYNIYYSWAAIKKLTT